MDASDKEAQCYFIPFSTFQLGVHHSNKRHILKMSAKGQLQNLHSSREQIKDKTDHNNISFIAHSPHCHHHPPQNSLLFINFCHSVLF